MDQNAGSAIVAILFWGFVIVGFIITFIKKRSQVGKTWSGGVGAKVTIKEKVLKCSHCGHDRFSKREGLVTTSWITFIFRSQFWNQSARCFQCKSCGFLHWFVDCKEEAEITFDE